MFESPAAGIHCALKTGVPIRRNCGVGLDPNAVHSVADAEYLYKAELRRKINLT